MRREEKDTALEGYRPVFDKVSIRWGLVFVDDQIAIPIVLRRKLIETLHFGHSGTTKMLSDAKIFWWPEMRKDIEQKVKDCTACLATGKNLKSQIPKNHYGKLEKLSEPGQELQIDFTGKVHNKNLNGEPQILVAIDGFSKWPTVKCCKTSDTKEVISSLSNQFKLYGVPEKIKSDKGGAFIFISTEYKEFGKSRNTEVQTCPPRLHTGNETVERAIQIMKNLILANMQDGNNLTESANRDVRSNAVHNTHGTKENAIRTSPRSKTENGANQHNKRRKIISVKLVRTIHFSTKSAQNTDICRKGR